MITWASVGSNGHWGFSSPLAGNLYGALSSLNHWNGPTPSDMGIGQEADDLYLIYGHYYASSLIKAYNDKLEADSIKRKSRKK